MYHSLITDGNHCMCSVLLVFRSWPVVKDFRFVPLTDQIPRYSNPDVFEVTAWGPVTFLSCFALLLPGARGTNR